LNKLLSHHSGRTLQEIEDNTDRDNFLTAEEALEFNLIDRVVATLSETTDS
jgi:ATP-dependent Clp protease protease subunit